MKYTICHVFPFFSIRHFGGTSDWMYKLAKAQAQCGMEPTILSGDYLFDWELAKTLPKVNFTVLCSFLDKVGFSLSPALFHFCRSELKSYDVVHMHVFRTFQNIVLYFYYRKYNIPYIIDAHGAVLYYTRKRFLRRAFDLLIGHRMLRDAAAVIAETKAGVEEYVDISPSLSKEDVQIISPPFDIDEFSDLPERGQFRSKLGLEPETKLILFLGRIHWIIGNDYLIRGFAEFQKKQPSTALAIVGGDDGHMEECKKLVNELGLEDYVHFPGFLAAEHKLAALVNADVVAQLSRHEQGAWAPIEAVLADNPIIVSQNTGSGEGVVRLKAGYTVDSENPKSVASELDKIFANFDDAKQITAKAAENIAKYHSMGARLSEFDTLYRECRHIPFTSSQFTSSG